MDKSYKWCCKNPECEMLNMVEPAQIEDAVKNSQKQIFICANCEFVGVSVEIGTEHNEDYMHDIPLESWENRLIIGSISDGTFVDYQGKHPDRHEFIVKYGVDPQTYLKWQKSGKPKPKNKC